MSHPPCSAPTERRIRNQPTVFCYGPLDRIFQFSGVRKDTEFSPRQIATIQAALRKSGAPPVCPCCSGRLSLMDFDYGKGEVYFYRLYACSGCRRSLMVFDEREVAPRRRPRRVGNWVEASRLEMAPH